MSRSFVLKLVGACIAAAFASFSIVHIGLESRRVRLTPAHAGYFASNLLTCTKANSLGSDPRNCSESAKQLIAVLSEVSPSQFEFYKHERFDVFRTGRHLTLHKKSCTDADIAVDNFVVNAWPLDPGGEGVGKVTPFSKHGHRVGSSCVIVVEIPFDNPSKFYIGQLDVNRKYVWIASYP